MYLLDTNVWLERLLGQQRSEEVRQLLEHIPLDRLFITDFSVHSIGVILYRVDRLEALKLFVQDVFIDGAVVLVRLDPEDTQRLLEVINQYKLDFDDAYQYVASEKYHLTLISFDRDYDRTERQKKTPSEILKDLTGNKG
ncbi:MAG: type II toxin-antitoxin system VapC family toxin [Acidobacteria bacterium]|nr:type II toxin-antitoxin system VapC family toxin [Acidobacteriota bacterium]MBI3654913.1 type II toxin-antitoxin system VapC family toxin [Acidobacteriota bacterium]